MGKGARDRRRRADTAAAEPFFHGGVPGKAIGEILVPATRLGLQYQYRVADSDYDPGWVYLTTDVGAAHGYASRYLACDGRSIPGDVYRVQPLGGVHVDPDYEAFPEAFARCAQARIVAVVAREVVLTAAEQIQRQRPYQVWGHRDRPFWDDDGLILPSEQMLGYGATRAWTTLLRPWLGPDDVDGRGQLLIAHRSTDFWATVLDCVPSLAREHPIELRRSWRGPPYRCTNCGEAFADEPRAALHQLGDAAVAQVARIHGMPLGAVCRELAAAAHARDPHQWAWLSTQKG